MKKIIVPTLLTVILIFAVVVLTSNASAGIVKIFESAAKTNDVSADVSAPATGTVEGDKNGAGGKSEPNTPSAPSTPSTTDVPEVQPPDEIDKEPDKSGPKEIDKDKPMVALTFDDGPHPQNTIRILEALEKHNGKGTFFVVGSRAEKFKSAMEKIAQSGSQIGNHTYNHRELTKLSGEEIKNDVGKTSNIIYKILNIRPEILRPTYGSVNKNVKQYAGVPLILWSIDTLDWKTKDKDSVVDKVLSSVRDGDIILMHDLYESTAEAAEVIIEELDRKGYQMVTIKELYQAKGIELESGKVYSNAYK